MSHSFQVFNIECSLGNSKKLKGGKKPILRHCWRNVPRGELTQCLFWVKVNLHQVLLCRAEVHLAKSYICSAPSRLAITSQMNTGTVSGIRTIRRHSHHVSVVPSSEGLPWIGSCRNEFWSHRSRCWSSRFTFLSVKKVWKSICTFALMGLVLAIGRTGKWWFLMFFVQLSFL